jgi:1-acyl-sn-glycerol-3-phosphate acyltransferase
MMKLLQRILLEIVRWPLVNLWHLTGWNVSQDLPDDPRLVITGAPHTTNWDYLVFLMAALHQRRRPYVTVKKELFFPPLGWILHLLGGLSIDRQNPGDIARQIAEKIREADSILMVFTPEGTRGHTKFWKTGFYYVALEADVPILCGAINWQEKVVYLDLRIEPTGDIEADFELIKAYQEKHGRGLYPENEGVLAIRSRRSKQHEDTVNTETKTVSDSM